MAKLVVRGERAIQIADYLVKAANSHAGLVAALKGILAFAERHVDHDALRNEGGDDGQGHYEGEYWWSNAVLAARKALADARGER